MLFPVIGLTALAVGALAVWLSFYRAAPAVSSQAQWSGWWFPFGWFFVIPVFFLIFFVCRWFLWGGRWWGRGAYYGWGQDGALEILRERFARGELTTEQYEQMRKDLGSS
jgi:putative membrane protein